MSHFDEITGESGNVAEAMYAARNWKQYADMDVYAAFGADESKLLIDEEFDDVDCANMDWSQIAA